MQTTYNELNFSLVLASVESWFGAIPSCIEGIATKFCTCHDSDAVMTCADTLFQFDNQEQ